MSNETWQRVCNVLAIFSGTEPAAMAPGQCLGETQTANHYDATAFLNPLGLDSLDLIEVTLKLQEEFGIEISDAECDSPALGHIAGLVAFVQGKLDSKPIETMPIPHDLTIVHEAIRQCRDDLNRITGIGIMRAAAHENGHRPDRNCSGCGRPY